MFFSNVKARKRLKKSLKAKCPVCIYLSVYLFNYLSIYLHISLLFTYGCRVESMIPNVVLLVEVDEFLVVYKYIISILRYRVNIYQVIQVRGH